MLFFILPYTFHAKGELRKGPNIPEPMVFDLVLPLGSDRGKYELNTLFQYNEKNKTLETNPEFEYGYAKGHGIEFELPTENSSIQAYKVSLQGTFNLFLTQHFIHGWQYIYQYNKQSKAHENSVLYIFGYQFNEKLSTLNMGGFRITDISSNGAVEGLMNANLFYGFSKKLLLGLEINWEVRTNLSDSILAMPQIHHLLAKHVELQFGMGMLNMNHHYSPHVVTRIVFDF
ncbi:hypothetical protein [Nitrosomonas supralitoralis]|uniref:MetA-pathway of phenol degradation n=1 Tax=Nitrosomonas supralitoralis TaxID=2116706 RepID=A0A2P7NQP6_9PROT|nr:hypothetical protein [Nitrosomonas supralitoralis]PSJ15780.1 hypothetical protein C7H79_17140 [Nitrosomonas supralitoralis]